MKQKHFDFAIQFLILTALFLTAVIFDRRIGIVFSLSKANELRFFLILIMSIWAIKILIFKESKLIRSSLDWPLLSYLLACTIATITSVNVYVSFIGFYGRFEGLITLYSYALLFFIITNYAKDLKFTKNIAAVICSAGTVMAVYGIIQRKGIDPYAWGGVNTWERVIGTIGQPNFFAAYMDMAFLITLILFLIKKGPLPKKDVKMFFPFIYFIAPVIIFLLMMYNMGTTDVFFWYLGFAVSSVFAVLFAFKYEEMSALLLETTTGISLILIYIALFYTQSRGGFIGFFAALTVFFMLAPRKLLIENWQKLLILFMALGLVTGVTVIDPQFSLFARMTSEIKIDQPQKNDSGKIEFLGAAGSRGETWKSAFRIISDYPIFGIGPEVMKMVFPRYETDLFRFKEQFHVKQDRCHNETFDVPVTRGLISFFAYLIVLGVVFRQGIKALKDASEEKKLIIAAFIASITAYLIQNQFSFGVVAITSLFWVTWAVVVKAEELPPENSETKGFADVPWIPAAVVVIIAVILTYYSAIPFRMDVDFKMGTTLSEVRRYEESLYYFDLALNKLPFEGGPITHKSISLINLANQSGPELKERIQKDAIDTLKYGTLIDPYNADIFYILSRICLAQGKNEAAVENAKIALLIDPYYAEVHLVLAAIAEKNNDSKEAMRHYKEAYRLNPTLPDAKEKIVWDFIEQGSLEQAYNMAQEILMNNPRNIGAHKALGTIYFKKGDLQKSREEFDAVSYLKEK